MKRDFVSELNKKQCENCGSYDIVKSSALKMALILFLMSCLFILIPIIGWVGAPITFLLSLLCLLSAPFEKKVTYTCNSCKYKWEEQKVKNNN